MRTPQPYKKESVTIAHLAELMRSKVGVAMELVNGADPEGRVVTDAHLLRPGVALTGYTELFAHERVQVLGNTECRYLAHVGEEAGVRALEALLAFDLPCIVLTHENRLSPAYLAAAEARGVPVYTTPEPTMPFMYKLQDLLEDQFAYQVTLHGSLVDVYGIGLLITGPAGIGKSEIALDLVERGHRLVADDVVIATNKEGVLMGSGTELGAHFMEIRGLGIVDVRAMFGVRAIRFQKRIELVVRVHPWDREEEYTRLGMVDEQQSILDVALPLVKLPVIPGKNVTVICEVIAMNHLLAHYGYDPAEVFARRLAERIGRGGGPAGRAAAPQRGIEWFEHDLE